MISRKFILILVLGFISVVAKSQNILLNEMCVKFDEVLKSESNNFNSIFLIQQDLRNTYNEEYNNIIEELKSKYSIEDQESTERYYSLYSAFYLIDNCSSMDLMLNKIYGNKPKENEYLIKLEKEAEKIFNKCLAIDCENFNTIIEEYSEMATNMFFNESDLVEKVYGTDLTRMLTEMESYMFYNKNYLKIIIGSQFEKMK